MHNEIPHSCKGVKCMQSFCRNQAMHKVGEYNPFNGIEEKEQHAAFNGRHEKTTYLCDEHFDKLMKREEFYGDISTYKSTYDSLEGCPFYYCNSNPKCSDKCRYANHQPPVTG